MPKRFWEDFIEGSLAEYGPRAVTREEIMAFAAEFDPQPMHLDEHAARASMLGGLAASGWHICVLVNRLLADGLMNEAHAMGAPGVDEVKWLKPVRPGDRLTIHAKVLEKRASRSRPEMGFVNFHFEVRTQAAETVMTLRCRSWSLAAHLRTGKRRSRPSHEIFRGYADRRQAHGRTPYVHGGGDQIVREEIRSAAIPSRRGASGALAFWRAVRIGLCTPC